MLLRILGVLAGVQPTYQDRYTLRTVQGLSFFTEYRYLMSEHPSDPPVPIPESDTKLLDQCRVDTFRSGGKGGQHQNVTESGVRLTHLPSGLVTSSRSLRSQLGNKRAALRALRRKLIASQRRPRRRIPTRIPRAAKERRLKAKRKRSNRKSLRRKPLDET